jgi:hypothetical protein
MHDYTDGREVIVSQNDLEYIGDVAELFLSFLHAVGYNYIKQVVVIKDGGDEVTTE